MWFCVYEVQTQAKLVSDDENQDGVYMCERVWGVLLTGRECKETWRAKSVLYLDLGRDYFGACICKVINLYS